MLIFHTAASRLFPSLWGGGGDEVQGAPGIVRAQCGDKRPQAGPGFFFCACSSHAWPTLTTRRRNSPSACTALGVRTRLRSSSSVVSRRWWKVLSMPQSSRRARSRARAFQRSGVGGETDLFGCDELGAGATGFVTALVAFQVQTVILEARDFTDDAGPLKSWAQIDQLGICPYHPERRDPAKPPPAWNGAAAKFVRLEWE